MIRWLVLFGLSFLLSLAIFHLVDQGWASQTFSWFRDHRWRNLKRLGATIAIALGVGVLSAIVFTLFWGEAFDPDDFRPRTCCGLICGAIAIAIVQWRAIASHIEWGFLLTCLTMGLTIQCVVVPYVNLTADDQAHLAGALSISYIVDGQYSPIEQTIIDRSVDGWPWRWASELEGDPPTFEETFHDIFSWNAYEKTIEYLDSDVSPDEITEFEGTSAINGGSYLIAANIGRIPLAIGLWFGRLLGLPLSGQLIASRISSLLFYAFVTFAAMRLLRSGKLILMVVALFPPIVMLAATFSYDPWLICLLYLGFAQFARVISSKDEVFDFSTTLKVLIPLLLGLLVKAICFPIVLIVALGPRLHYGTRRQRTVFLLLTAATICILLLLIVQPFFVNSGASYTDSSSPVPTDSRGQISYILNSPIGYAKTFLSWAAAFFNPHAAVDGFFINFFITQPAESVVYAWYLSPFILPIEALMLATTLLARNNADARYRTPWLIVGTLILELVSFLLIATALYVSYTSVGAPTIIGVQYRYLFPLLFPLLLFTFNSPLMLKVRPSIVNTVVWAAESILVFAYLWSTCFAMLS